MIPCIHLYILNNDTRFVKSTTCKAICTDVKGVCNQTKCKYCIEVQLLPINVLIIYDYAFNIQQYECNYFLV